MALLKSQPGVRIAEPNYRLTYHESPYYPNDPMWAYEGDTGDPTSSPYNQWGPAMCGASFSWHETKGSSDVVVAIIDTGINRFHEDLVDNIWINEDELPSDGIDNDLNGYIDDWWGWNCWDMNNNPFDDAIIHYYHGTACAGIVAATQDNHLGLSGIALGVKLMAVKINVDEYDPFISAVVEALNYVSVNEVDIANMSFGTIEHSEILEMACNAAWDDGDGTILIAAAGNENTYEPMYPAIFDSVIGVGATSPWTSDLQPRDESRIIAGDDGVEEKY